jgi:hypothetical protein
MEFTTHFELHSQATRLVEDIPCDIFEGTYGIGTLCDLPFNGSYPSNPSGIAPLDYNSTTVRQADFKVELFPVHSPLLRESLLVSFPPLNNMLKSSGSSYLISGRMLKADKSFANSRKNLLAAYSSAQYVQLTWGLGFSQ